MEETAATFCLIISPSRAHFYATINIQPREMFFDTFRITYPLLTFIVLHGDFNFLISHSLQNCLHTANYKI